MEVKVDDAPKDEVLKVYKEKPYFNSNKEPFGITLNGKSREYVAAHENVKALIVKGKVITTSIGKIKVKDASHRQGMINAIVEVDDETDKGNVEIKVYNPSLNKKKGATIEIRKVSDYDYSYVVNLKNIITNMLDKYLGDKDMHGCKFFTCNICNWQTRFEPALKGHKKRMHAPASNLNNQFPCNECAFKTGSKPSLLIHMNTKYQKETKKRTKVNYKWMLINVIQHFIPNLT